MKLFILNDNVNSFEHVIRCIQRYLNYPYMQAASIASIVHNSGRCLVKESNDELMIKGVEGCSFNRFLIIFIINESETNSPKSINCFASIPREVLFLIFSRRISPVEICGI